MTFTPAELAAADTAFSRHSNGYCPDDCSFCYDLLLAGEEKFTAELQRIQKLKRGRKQQSMIPEVKPVMRKRGKGKAAPLAGRMKKADHR